MGSPASIIVLLISSICDGSEGNLFLDCPGSRNAGLLDDCDRVGISSSGYVKAPDV